MRGHLIPTLREKIIDDENFNHQNNLFLYQIVSYDDGGWD
jgi:hypothetical protein